MDAYDRYEPAAGLSDVEDEYESTMPASAGGLPSVVVAFLQQLNNSFASNDMRAIMSCYDNEFGRISTRFFSSTPWPSTEQVGQIVSCHPVFLIMYRELYYRHIMMMRGSVDHALYVESWGAYKEMFDAVVEGRTDGVDVPSEWLYDCLVEFGYQFQKYAQYWSNPKTLSADELGFIQRKTTSEWTAPGVLTLLYDLVERSRVRAYLDVARSRTPPPPTNAQKLGYFGLITLCRIHILMGDFHTALKVLAPLDLSRNGLFTTVSNCHAALHYYIGFCYLMTRRYADAIIVFNSALLVLSSGTRAYVRSQKSNALQKRQHRMLALLAIALSLCPAKRVDEPVMRLLLDRVGEKLQQLQRGTEGALATYEDLFTFGAPKFIVPAVPDYNEAVDYTQLTFRAHVDAFLEEVRQQCRLPQLRSYLNLYSAISLEKLATLYNHGRDSEDKTPDASLDAVRQQLLCLKHKGYQLVRADPEMPPHAGGFANAAGVAFFMDGNVVHVDSVRPPRPVHQHFVAEIERFQHMLADVRRA